MELSRKKIKDLFILTIISLQIMQSLHGCVCKKVNNKINGRELSKC